MLAYMLRRLLGTIPTMLGDLINEGVVRLAGKQTLQHSPAETNR